MPFLPQTYIATNEFCFNLKILLVCKMHQACPGDLFCNLLMLKFVVRTQRRFSLCGLFHWGHLCAGVTEQFNSKPRPRVCHTFSTVRWGFWVSVRESLEAAFLGLPDLTMTWNAPGTCHFLVTFRTEEMETWKAIFSLKKIYLSSSSFMGVSPFGYQSAQQLL